jgi:hypothetical protein
MTTVRLSEATQDQLHCTSGCKLDFDARLITPCAGHRVPARKTCAGAAPRGPAGARGACFAEPQWGVFDTHHAGQPDRYTCDAHLHAAIDRERGALIVPFRH